MSSIGPQLPPHLQNRRSSHQDEEDDDDEIGPRPSIGPQIPPTVGVRVHDDEEDDETPSASNSGGIGPAIPAHLLKGKGGNVGNSKDEGGRSTAPRPGPSRPSPPPPRQAASIPSEPGPSTSGRRVIGPSLPTYGPTYNPQTYSQAALDEDDSDDDVGPKPLPSGMQHEQSNAVKEFIEREERRKKQLEEANKPKAPQREEWMLAPPSHSDLLANLDPSKLKKARQFSRSTAEPRTKTDSSLWTETPAERQKRLEDEVMGKKRRAVDPTPVDDDPEKKRRRQEEAKIRKGVDDYTKKVRGPSLIDQHGAAAKGQEASDEPPMIWDHSRDMGLGGRLMDDDKRNQMLREAKGLGSRFSTGKSGGFL